jgi:glutathione peroxidase
MNKFSALVLIFGVIFAVSGLAEKKDPASLWDIPIQTIDGKAATLAPYKGKVILIVNTASQCGFTPQYAGLEKLHQSYKEKGFSVLAFPSNDFGGQEPGSEKEIKKFCELKYKTTFPLFAKVGVKENPHPLYKFLQNDTKQTVGWNFGKFLVSKDGKVQYFPSKVEPFSDELKIAVEKALEK